eukprot:GDKI01017622.1.p1 GENE.GDKI01017622.1~~GDKI01017622.1.p1  ORF type:complete len:1092 (-),score=207.65 GDKI01017622.1:301-3576(-)
MHTATPKQETRRESFLRLNEVQPTAVTIQQLPDTLQEKVETNHQAVNSTGFQRDSPRTRHSSENTAATAAPGGAAVNDYTHTENNAAVDSSPAAVNGSRNGNARGSTLQMADGSLRRRSSLAASVVGRFNVVDPLEQHRHLKHSELRPVLEALNAVDLNLKWNDTWCTLCVMLQLALAIWEHELFFSQTFDFTKGAWKSEPNTKRYILTDTLRCLVWAISIILTYGLLQHYAFLYESERLEWGQPNRKHLLQRFVLPLFLEIAVHFIQPIPFFDNAVDDLGQLSVLLTGLMVLRVYWLLRLWMRWSPYSSDQARFEKYNADNFIIWTHRKHVSWVLKATIRSNPTTLLLCLLTPVMLIASYLMLISERQYPVTDKYTINTFQEAIWSIFITMTTVGYGDYYPKTGFGRAVSIFLAIFGLMWQSAMVVALKSGLALSESEQEAMKMIDESHNENKLKVHAARVIFTMWKYQCMAKVTKRGGEDNTPEREFALQHAHRRCIAAVQRFRTVRDHLVSDISELVGDGSEADLLRSLELNYVKPMEERFSWTRKVLLRTIQLLMLVRDSLHRVTDGLSETFIDVEAELDRLNMHLDGVLQSRTHDLFSGQVDREVQTQKEKQKQRQKSEAKSTGKETAKKPQQQDDHGSGDQNVTEKFDRMREKFSDWLEQVHAKQLEKHVRAEQQRASRAKAEAEERERGSIFYTNGSGEGGDFFDALINGKKQQQDSEMSSEGSVDGDETGIDGRRFTDAYGKAMQSRGTVGKIRKSVINNQTTSQFDSQPFDLAKGVPTGIPQVRHEITGKVGGGQRNVFLPEDDGTGDGEKRKKTAVEIAVQQKKTPSPSPILQKSVGEWKSRHGTLYAKDMHYTPEPIPLAGGLIIGQTLKSTATLGGEPISSGDDADSGRRRISNIGRRSVSVQRGSTEVKSSVSMLQSVDNSRGSVSRLSLRPNKKDTEDLMTAFPQVISRSESMIAEHKRMNSKSPEALRLSNTQATAAARSMRAFGFGLGGSPGSMKLPQGLKLKTDTFDEKEVEENVQQLVKSRSKILMGSGVHDSAGMLLGLSRATSRVAASRGSTTKYHETEMKQKLPETGIKR